MTEDPYDELKNLPPEYVARMKAQRDQRLAADGQRNEEYARTFKRRDFVHGVYGTLEGRIDPNSDVITIARWSDDYGNTVYVKPGSKEDYPPEPQIRTLSERVQVQQTAFNSLDPSEQTRIRTDFTSPGNKPDSRFSDYLNNEALAVQFQKLK